MFTALIYSHLHVFLIQDLHLHLPIMCCRLVDRMQLSTSEASQPHNVRAAVSVDAVKSLMKIHLLKTGLRRLMSCHFVVLWL